MPRKDYDEPEENEDDFEAQEEAPEDQDDSDNDGGVTEDDLEEFDDDFSTDATFPEKVDVLEDGDYTFEIVKIDLRKAGDATIFELTLLCEDDGQRYTHTYWLNRQIGINILGKDLVTLGIDADEWEKFSAGLIDLARNRKDELVGVRFIAKKGTNRNGYCTFYVNAPQKRKPTGGTKPSGGKGGGKGTGSTRRDSAPPEKRGTRPAGGKGSGRKSDDDIPF
jgi:hypothetical protein